MSVSFEIYFFTKNNPFLMKNVTNFRKAGMLFADSQIRRFADSQIRRFADSVTFYSFF
jgi:hypothetical protein